MPAFRISFRYYAYSDYRHIASLSIELTFTIRSISPDEYKTKVERFRNTMLTIYGCLLFCV